MTPGRPVLLAAAWLAGCAVDRPPSEDPPVPTLATPQIVDASLECDVDAGRWTLVVVADAWTGGAVTHWTVDGEYVETHRVPSVKLAADGTADTLRLELAVVADWRDVVPGGSTDFSCASDPNVVLALRDADGEPVDCVGWGPDPSVWGAVSGVAACE